MFNKSYISKVREFSTQIYAKARMSVDANTPFIQSSTTNRIVSPFHILLAFSFSLSILFIILGWQRDQKPKSEAQNFFFSLGINIFNSSAFLFVVEFFLIPSARNRVTIEEGINYEGFAARIRKSKHNVDIFTTFIGPFTSIKEYNGVQDIFCKAIKDAYIANSSNTDFHVKILLLIPWSKAAEQRSEDISGVEEFEVCLHESLFTLFELCEDDTYKDYFRKIEVRLYNYLPPFFLLRCDGDAAAIHYLPKRSLRVGERIEFKVKSPHGAAYMKSLDYLWKLRHTKLNEVVSIYYVSISKIGNVEYTDHIHLPYIIFDENFEDRSVIHLLFNEANSRHMKHYHDLLEAHGTSPPVKLSIVEAIETISNYTIISFPHCSPGEPPGSPSSTLQANVHLKYGPRFTKFVRLEKILPVNRNDSSAL